MMIATMIRTGEREKKLREDLRTLATFVGLFCRGKGHEGRSEVSFNGFNSKDLCRKPLVLCPECARLLHHGLVKRSHCPQDPKPACKECATPCYDKAYRMRMREVMRFSGWRLLLRGRIDLLLHLLRKPTHKGHTPGGVASQFQESGGEMGSQTTPGGLLGRTKLGSGLSG